MKQIFLISILIISAFVLFPVSTIAAQSGVAITVDNSPVNFDVEPTIINGRTLVPFRALAEALKVNVTWNGANQSIVATNNTTSIFLQINNKTALLNQAEIALDASPVLLYNRTLVPLRFFSEAFGCNVAWDSSKNTINILSAPSEMKVTGFYALGDKNTSSWTNLFQKPYPNSSPGNTDVVDVLALGWYSLDKEGNLLTKSDSGWQKPAAWEQVLVAARKYDLKTEMVLHLTNSQGAISELISNEKSVKNAINSILGEARFYKSVNLDFEGLGWNDTAEELIVVQNNFTNFVQQLADILKKAKINLTLTLHAPNSAYKGYNYQALGQIADEIIIMAYDYGPTPEPIALVRQAVETARNQVPANKLILGISAPNETAQSMSTKITLAKQEGLKGIALWRLGLINDEMWQILRSSK